jgi:hypothetical protein
MVAFPAGLGLCLFLVFGVCRHKLWLGIVERNRGTMSSFSATSLMKSRARMPCDDGDLLVEIRHVNQVKAAERSLLSANGPSVTSLPLRTRTLVAVATGRSGARVRCCALALIWWHTLTFSFVASRSSVSPALSQAARRRREPACISRGPPCI